VAAIFSNIAKANVRLMMEEGRNNPAATHVATYYAKDFVYHGTNGMEIRSRRAYEYALSRAWRAEPQPRHEIEDQVSDGDCVLTRWRLIGDGYDDTLHMSLIRFDNGMAMEQWEMIG
jgi:predicted SnoaL-like aldol condensation-catalyzing enzyme